MRWWCSAIVFAGCGFNAPNQGGGDAGPGSGSDAAPVEGDAGIDAEEIEIDAPLGAPSVPREVTAVPGDHTITVAWLAPADPGTAGITGYHVSAIPDDTTLPSAACTVTDLGCQLTGLVNGATYSIVVVATSSAGDSPRSAPALAMPRPDELTNNVAVWLEAGDLTPGAVSTWTSRDPQGRNATQSNPGEQPTRGTLAGAPAVQFDGADDSLLTPGFLQGNASYTIVTVTANHETIPMSESVSPVYANRQCGERNNGFAMYSYNSYFGNTSQLRPGAEGSNLDVNNVDVNGSASVDVPNDTNVETGVVVAANTWMVVGHRVHLRSSIGQNTLALGSYNPTSCHKGAISIGELIVFGRQLNNDALKAVERYLAQKWRVALP